MVTMLMEEKLKGCTGSCSVTSAAKLGGGTPVKMVIMLMGCPYNANKWEISSTCIWCAINSDNFYQEEGY
jgi:hypothetical protein